MTSRFVITGIALAVLGLGATRGAAQTAANQLPPAAVAAQAAYPGPISSSPAVGETGTLAGSVMAGAGALASGAGQYNYNTALASRLNEEANRQMIDDHARAVVTQYQLRELNNKWWLSQNPRMTAEQMAQIDNMRRPNRLSLSELDPVWGIIQWPAVLQQPEFDSVRSQLDDIFAHRIDERFGVGTPAFHRVQTLTAAMNEMLTREANVISQTEWIHAHRFLESLAYEARFPAVAADSTVNQVSLNR